MASPSSFGGIVVGFALGYNRFCIRLHRWATDPHVALKPVSYHLAQPSPIRLSLIAVPRIVYGASLPPSFIAITRDTQQTAEMLR